MFGSLALVWLSASSGAVEVSNSVAVHFFRSPQSKFSSGQKSLVELQKYSISETSPQMIQIEKDKRKTWLREDQLILLPKLLTQFPKGNFTLNWMPQDLKSSPAATASTLLSLPELTVLELVSLHGDWAKVKFSPPFGVDGFIPLAQLLLPIDFAAFVLLPTAQAGPQWFPVSHREVSTVVLKSGSRIPLSSVESLNYRDRLGFVASDFPESGLFRRQLVEVLSKQDSLWRSSQLPGHGLVYWKTPKPESQTASHLNWTTDQLLKKEIFSVSFHPQNPNIGLLSADGVFFTTNGTTWTKITQFKDQNLPVLVGPDRTFFVGHVWSKDLGQTFQAFLKFDVLAKMIQAHSQRPPPQIKLDSLTLVPPHNLKVALDTGTRKIQISGNPETHAWILRE